MPDIILSFAGKHASIQIFDQEAISENMLFCSRLIKYNSLCINNY